VRVVLKPFEIGQLLAAIEESLATSAADSPQAEPELSKLTMIHEGGAFDPKDDGSTALQHR
jgi:hypothetical protein